MVTSGGSKTGESTALLGDAETDSTGIGDNEFLPLFILVLSVDIIGKLRKDGFEDNKSLEEGAEVILDRLSLVGFLLLPDRPGVFPRLAYNGINIGKGYKRKNH